MPVDRTLLLADEDGGVQRYSVLEETARASRPKDAKGYSDAYVTVFQGALLRAANIEGITRTQLRVWMAALARATIENAEFDAEPAQIGAALGMDPKTVIRSVTQLVAHGLLLRPRRGKLALPPDVAWRGTVIAREAALKARKDQA